MKQEKSISEETWIFLLLIAAIFSTEFLVMRLIGIISPETFKVPLEGLVLGASMLVLIVFSLLLIPRRKILESKNKLDMIVDCAGDGLLVIDKDYRVVMANSEIEKLTEKLFITCK